MEGGWPAVEMFPRDVRPNQSEMETKASRDTNHKIWLRLLCSERVPSWHLECKTLHPGDGLPGNATVTVAATVSIHSLHLDCIIYLRSGPLPSKLPINNAWTSVHW